MSRRLAAAVVLLLAALVAVPAAAGDGPMPYASQNGLGVAGPGPNGRAGPLRYVAVSVNQGADTVLETIRPTDGMVWGTLDLDGQWGVPITTYDQGGAGLTPDGKTLVLGDAVPVYPHTPSKFLVIDTKRLQIRTGIYLKGDFAFDAISPDGTKLYLIQHVDPTQTQRYVVRLFDVAQHRLLPGRIADRTQKSWIMQGYPTSRATTAGGRWVYTLYQNPGGYPFVHALDTVRGVAHCIGLPWHGSQNGFYNVRLTLKDDNRTLAVHWLSGKPMYRVDTRTWAVREDHRSGPPWLWIALGSSLAAAGVAAVLLLRRRRRGEELEQELADLLRLPEREVVV